MGWNALRQSHAESNSRSSPPIMSLLPTSPPSADEIYFRKVDKLDRPPVENGLRHVDGFDQIFGCSFAHHLPHLSQEHLSAEGLRAAEVPRRPSRRSEGLYASPLRQECSVTYEPCSS